MVFRPALVLWAFSRRRGRRYRILARLVQEWQPLAYFGSRQHGCSGQAAWM